MGSRRVGEGGGHGSVGGVNEEEEVVAASVVGRGRAQRRGQGGGLGGISGKDDGLEGGMRRRVWQQG